MLWLEAKVIAEEFDFKTNFCGKNIKTIINHKTNITKTLQKSHKSGSNEQMLKIETKFCLNFKTFENSKTYVYKKMLWQLIREIFGFDGN